MDYFFFLVLFFGHARHNTVDDVDRSVDGSSSSSSSQKSQPNRNNEGEGTGGGGGSIGNRHEKPSVDEEDELKEMKGNSLNGHEAKTFDSTRPKSSDQDDSMPTGPFFSDQDQVRTIFSWLSF